MGPTLRLFVALAHVYLLTVRRHFVLDRLLADLAAVAFSALRLVPRLVVPSPLIVTFLWLGLGLSLVPVALGGGLAVTPMWALRFLPFSVFALQ